MQLGCPYGNNSSASRGGDYALLQVANLVTSPHMAGVTHESIDRMAVQAAYNVLSVFDGKPIRENAVNPEVFD